MVVPACLPVSPVPSQGKPGTPHLPPLKVTSCGLFLGCLVVRHRGVSGRKSELGCVCLAEASSLAPPCSSDRCNLVDQGAEKHIRVERHAKPCFAKLHDASPGYHAAPTHLLPLPQYGRLKQGGEGNPSLKDSSGPSLVPGGYSHLELRRGGEVLIMFPPQSLINVYERQRGRRVPLKIEFRRSSFAHPLPPV